MCERAFICIFVTSCRKQKTEICSLKRAGDRSGQGAIAREAQMREARQQQQGSTHSVEGKKKQTHRPLSHTSSVTERNKQVCCTALSLPPPLLLSLGGARLLRDSKAAARLLRSLPGTKPVGCTLPLFLLLAAGSKRESR